MKNDEWTTPNKLVAYLNTRFGFNVDAAATARNKCFDHYYSKKNSFLKSTWQMNSGARLWINPPYSMAKEFAERAYFLYKYFGIPSYLLLPVRSDRIWYQSLLHAEDVRDEPFTGRIHFGKAKASAFMYNIGVIIGFKDVPSYESIDAGQFNKGKRGSATT